MQCMRHYMSKSLFWCCINFMVMWFLHSPFCRAEGLCQQATIKEQQQDQQPLKSSSCRGVQIRKPETRGLLKIGRVFSNQKAANPWVSLKNKASLWPTRAQGGIYLVIYQHRLIVYQKNRIDLFFPILKFVLQDKRCIWQNRQKCDRNLRSFESIAFHPMLTNTTLILQNKSKIRKEEINAVLLVYNMLMVLNHLHKTKMLGERLVGETSRQILDQLESAYVLRLVYKFSVVARIRHTYGKLKRSVQIQQYYVNKQVRKIHKYN